MLAIGWAAATLSDAIGGTFSSIRQHVKPRFVSLSPPELPRSLTVAWESGDRGRQHSNDPPIIHRDLKSPNVLITSTWDAKVRVSD